VFSIIQTVSFYCRFHEIGIDYQRCRHSRNLSGQSATVLRFWNTGYFVLEKETIFASIPMDNQVPVFVNQEEVSKDESTAAVIPSPSSDNQMADDNIPWYQVPGSIPSRVPIVVSQEEKLRRQEKERALYAKLTIAKSGNQKPKKEVHFAITEDGKNYDTIPSPSETKVPDIARLFPEASSVVEVVSQEDEHRKKEQALHSKWPETKSSDQQPKNETNFNLDSSTRAILLKLRNQDHFGLRLVRQVSVTEKAAVFYAVGENDLDFAVKIYASGKNVAKKEYNRLLELEEAKILNSPSPVLFRGHILITKWMDEKDYPLNSIAPDLDSNQTKEIPDESQQQRRRDLSPASRKAQKKAVKAAQAEKRRNADFKSLDQKGKSERKKISRRLYRSAKGDVGNDF